MRPLFVSCLVLVLAAEAHAVYYAGNPTVGFRVDRPAGDYDDGAVDVDKLRVHHCGGGYTDYDVSAVVDPVAGHEVTIAGGDHCSLTWFWDSDVVIDGTGASGAFTVEATADSVTIPLDTEIDPVLLTPWSVTSGTMGGGGPWILTYVD